MSATRRRLLTASMGLSMPYIRPVSSARRSLTFLGYSGMFQELYEPNILEPFVAQSRGDISVFYNAVPSSTQALATLRRQRELPEIDVVLLDVASARAATDEGLLEPIAPGSMPVLTELAPSATFPGIAGRGLFTEPLVLLFDAARVPPPPSWKSLWSGADERAIAIPAPPESAGIAFTLIAGRLFGGGNEQRVALSGITAISELARMVVTWDPRPDVYHAVGDGNAKFGVGWNMQAQVFSDRMGRRLGVVFPEEGTISRASTVSVVKGSRQPEAARALVAHMLGVEAQKTMVERMYLGPVNAKARYSEAALLRTANTQERVARAMAVDWLVVNAIREAIIQVWREVIPPAG
jgi:putative spermidine/putrescine transport system substrate-binding protein